MHPVYHFYLVYQPDFVIMSQLQKNPYFSIHKIRACLKNHSRNLLSLLAHERSCFAACVCFINTVADEVDPELLAKVLANLEMRALLNSLAKTMK